MTVKLGRKPRTFDPRIQKMSLVRKLAALVGAELPALPPAVDYTAGLPTNLGMMMNDSLGDCVEAAQGHFEQVWSFNATGVMMSPSDADIEAAYVLEGGYVIGNPSTDNGTVIQEALTDWLTNPINGSELSSFIELDDLTDFVEVKRTIWECGGVFIGFNVPNYLMENLTGAGSVWDVDPTADNTIVGGHCVIPVGYDPAGNMQLISWGALYTMTPAFWSAFVDEAYALASPLWIKATGSSPAGLSLDSLQSLMQELNVSTQLVQVILALAVTSEPMPPTSAAQASNSVVVTDAAGTVYPAVVLTGAEATPWNWAATLAVGAANGVATPLDINGQVIGAAVQCPFVVPTPVPVASYEAPTGISVTLAASSAAARAKFAALQKK